MTIIEEGDQMRRPYRRPGLTEREREVIQIERRWGSGQTALRMKLDEAEKTLGIDARAYALIVNALIDDPLAHEAAPRTMAELRSLRDLRRG